MKIKSIWGVVLYWSKKDTLKETLIEVVNNHANLEGADLRGIDFEETYSTRQDKKNQ